MRIISLHKDSSVPNSDAAIVMLRSIVDKPFRDGARVMPQDSTCLRIQSVSIVGDGHQHHPVYNDRRNFQMARVRSVERPLRPELRNIGFVDLAKSAVAAPGVVSVIRGPIVVDGCYEQLRGVNVKPCRDRGCAGALAERRCNYEKRKTKCESWPSYHRRGSLLNGMLSNTKGLHIS